MEQKGAGEGKGSSGAEIDWNGKRQRRVDGKGQRGRKGGKEGRREITVSSGDRNDTITGNMTRVLRRHQLDVTAPLDQCPSRTLFLVPAAARPRHCPAPSPDPRRLGHHLPSTTIGQPKPYGVPQPNESAGSFHDTNVSQLYRNLKLVRTLRRRL